MGTLVDITVEQSLHASKFFGLGGFGVEHLDFVLFLHDSNLVP